MKRSRRKRCSKRWNYQRCGHVIDWGCRRWQCGSNSRQRELEFKVLGNLRSRLEEGMEVMVESTVAWVSHVYKNGVWMEELRPWTLGLLEKANDSFGKAGKVIPAKEPMVEEAMDRIRFGLVVSWGKLDMASCSVCHGHCQNADVHTGDDEEQVMEGFRCYWRFQRLY